MCDLEKGELPRTGNVTALAFVAATRLLVLGTIGLQHMTPANRRSRLRNMKKPSDQPITVYLWKEYPLAVSLPPLLQTPMPLSLLP